MLLHKLHVCTGLPSLLEHPLQASIISTPSPLPLSLDDGFILISEAGYELFSAVLSSWFFSHLDPSLSLLLQAVCENSKAELWKFLQLTFSLCIVDCFPA